jgi:HK97 family phage portal protein
VIVATPDGLDRQVELGVAEFGTSAIPAPSSAGGTRAYSGAFVTAENAFGLPAAMAAIRLVVELIASLPIVVYRGDAGARQLATDSWQYTLLNQFGNLDQSPFDLISDIASGPEGYGNSLVRKLRDSKGRIGELLPIPPQNLRRIRIDKNTRQKVFDVYEDGKLVTYDQSQVLHVRGFNPQGGLTGYSPIAWHRHALGTALALQEFGGRFFANNAQPPFAIAVPGSLNQKAAQEMLTIFTDSHSGLQNVNRPALLSNGAKIEKIGISMLDAQYVEMMKFSVEEIARIWRVPADLLAAYVQRGTAMTVEQESLRLLQFSLFPRIRRIESALHTDPDLFPPDRPEYPKFLIEELLRADTAVQAAADASDVQTGIMLRDEVRARRGLPPLPGDAGKIPQITPVGGAPNPSPLPKPPGKGSDPFDQE